MQLRIAGFLVVMFASGCARVMADDEAARLAAEDAVIGALLVDTKAAFGDTLWLRPNLDAQLSRPAEVDEAAWVMRISRVGFNSARDSAVVSTSYTCGPVCGRFSTVLLARTVDRWEIVATIFEAWS